MIEMIISHYLFLGAKPIAFYIDRWRIKILKALGYGIIRLDKLVWISCTTREEKTAYITEMTSPVGATTPIFPERIIKDVENRWKEPETESDKGSDTEDGGDIFDDEVVGSGGYYEEDTMPDTEAHSTTHESHSASRQTDTIECMNIK